MKFTIPDKSMRQEQRVEALRKWHAVFLWWPTRTGPRTIQWLEEVTRRNTNTRGYYSGWTKENWKEFFAKSSWEYGPLTNLLMQPKDDQQYATAGVATQQSYNPPPPNVLRGLVGHGVLQAPAGGFGIPGGLGNSFGNVSAQLQNQSGGAHAGPPPYGAGNQATP